MLIVIAAAAAAILAPAKPAPFVVVKTSLPKACAAGIIESGDAVRYDREAPDVGAIDRLPDLAKPLLFSAVESRVDGCSLPVLRIRASEAPPVDLRAAPVER